MKLHTCGPAPCVHDSGDLASRFAPPPGDRPFTVDVHCHAIVPAVEAMVAGRPEKQAEPAQMLATLGEPSMRHNQQKMLPDAGPRLVSVERRLADMDAMGVDVQVVSPSPTQYYYWAEPDLGREIARACNAGIAGACEREPRRLVGLGTVPLQHGALAAEELEHAVRGLGLRGVEISSSAGALELDHESLAPFWAKAEALGAVVFIHPFGTTVGDRLARYYLQNTIGQPLETTIALSQLIFGGVLDRHPGLKLLAAHGGGYLPYYLGRSAHARFVRPEAARPRLAPRDYLKRIWFDTVVYEPATLRHLADLVGASQLVVGTDYPFDMGSYRVHELVAAIDGLSDDERRAVLGGTAARLFSIATGDAA
jgi:aminocarboxymuconate-semialdehyde decarboxylase